MSWAVEWTAQDVLVADSNKRAFDVAYESGSRVPMVVYAYNDNQPMYRLGHGDSWTTEAPVFATPPGQGGVDWIELVSHPRRNEIALFYSDDDGGLYAVIWDGEQWNESVAQQLESALNRRDFQNFAASYETLSGDLLVTWAHPVNTYDGFWSATKPNASSVFSSPLFDDTLTKPGPISLAPDAGDRISVAHLEHSCGGGSCDNFEAAIWNGSVWTAKTVVDGQLEQPYGSRPGTQPVGTAWVDENAYAVYAGNGVTGLDWGRWTMAGWTQQPDVPVSPAMAETVNVQALGLGSHALFVISDLSGDLWAKRRNDNSWIDTEGGARLGDIGIVEARPFHMTGRR
jgi:hypothetical protein